jgi:hypothetical protein
MIEKDRTQAMSKIDQNVLARQKIQQQVDLLVKKNDEERGKTMKQLDELVRQMRDYHRHLHSAMMPQKPEM